MKHFLFFNRWQYVFFAIMPLLLSTTYSRAQQTITIGNGTSTGQCVPIEQYYSYTYSQSIYTHDEIGDHDGYAITSIKYHFVNTNGSSSSFTDTIKVYIGNTSKTKFESTGDWISFDSLMLVYNGTYTISSSDEWITINFNTPFEYNNTDNIIIAVDENTDGYHSNSDEFYCHSTPNNQSIYYYNDYNNPDPQAPPAGRALTTYRPNIEIVLEETTCSSVTNITLSKASDTSVNVSWDLQDNTQTEWIIEYGSYGFNLGAGTQVTATTNAGTVINNLTNGLYDFYVRAVGSDNSINCWAFYKGCAITNYEGFGTETDPFKITSLEDLAELSSSSELWNKYFIQTADIDASETSSWNGGEGFSPIGISSSNYFSGNYNGAGHVIDSLYINQSSGDNIGLFGYTIGAAIDSLGITNCTILGNYYIGSLVGYNYYSQVSNSYATGAVSGDDFVGSLVGYNTTSSEVSNSYATGAVSGDDYVGGLVGYNTTSSEVSNSYATGAVSGNNYVGGLVGYNTTSSKVSNSYATAPVSGSNSVGGLVGYNSGTVSASFYNTETSGSTNGAGTGIITSEMQDYYLFIDAGWDFMNETANDSDEIWGFNQNKNNSFPFLAWQGYTHSPTPIIDSISDLELTTATTNFRIIELTTDISQYGICWDTTGSPSIDNNYTNQGGTNSTGNYTSQLTNLGTNKIYYVRAYTINATDTAYSKTFSFESIKLADGYTKAAGAGNALEFDGTNDYIDLGSPNAFDSLAMHNFSIDMWIKTTDAGRSILMGNYGDNPSVNFEINTGGFLRTYLNGTSFGDDQSVADGIWHHVATVVDFDNDLVKMYIDGIESYSGTNTVAPYVVNRNMMIGRDPRSGSYYFDGQMDEVRIWNKALTQAEIRSQYGSLAGNEDGLIAYYGFDEEEGDYVFDATDNSNNGTLMNGVSREIPSTAPVADPVLTTVPELVSFGSLLTAGESATIAYTIQNSGGGILHIDSLTYDKSNFSFSPTVDTIFSGESKAYEGTFIAPSYGDFSGYLKYYHNMGVDSILYEAYCVSLPTLSILSAGNITGTSTDVSFQVTDLGTPAPNQYGICWNTSGTPVLEDAYSDEGAMTETGTYNSTASGLKPITPYYARAYVVNGTIVTYSNELSFTTIKQTPVINWTTPADITYGTALSETELNATVDVNGTLTYSPAAGTILNAENNQELSVTFTPEYPDSVYEGSTNVRINVTKAALAVTSDATRTYGEENPTFTLVYSGFVNSEDESVLDTEPTATSTATATSETGTYDIVATGGVDDNYEFTYKTGTLTVGKASLTATAEDASRTYGEENPEFTFTYSGFVNDEDETVLETVPTVSCGATETSDAGTYEIVTAGGSDSNYDFNYQTGTLTVNKAALAVGVTDESITEGSDIPDFTLTYSGFVNSDDESVLDEGPTANCEATSESESGSYNIVVSGGSDNNYEMSYTNGTLTITPLTSIEDETIANVSVYPNPVSSIATIQLYGTDLPANYKLTTVTGKTLLIGELVSEKTSINLDELEQGMYILTIYNSKVSSTYSLIKE